MSVYDDGVKPPKRAPAQPPPPPKPPGRGTAAWFAWKKAEHQRHEEMRLVAEVLEQNGTTTRVLEAQAELRSPFFHAMLNREIIKAEAERGRFKTLDPVRGIAMRLLAEKFGRNLEGVNIGVRWDPALRRLGCKAEPSIPAIAAAVREVAKRRREKGA